MKGGRRTESEKLTPKCEGHEDPISLDIITDPYFAIRLLENGHYFCFDVRSLHEWFKTGSRKNPATNLLFSDANIVKILKKLEKVNLIKNVKYLRITAYGYRKPRKFEVYITSPETFNDDVDKFLIELGLEEFTVEQLKSLKEKYYLSEKPSQIIFAKQYKRDDGSGDVNLIEISAINAKNF